MTSPTIEELAIEQEINVGCAQCGDDLAVMETGTNDDGSLYVTVAPCQLCQQNVHEAAYYAGRHAGKQEGAGKE